jgi:outer membrane protein TolC
MVRIFAYFVFFISILLSSDLWGQAGNPLKLDELIAEALQNNPEMQAAQQRWLAAQQRDPQVTSLEDPMFSYTRWLSTPETRVGPQENVFALSQRIPFPGKLGLMGDMATEDAVAAGERHGATRRDVVFGVKKAYYDLYWVDQSLRILDEYLSLLQDFNRVAEQQYATGMGIQANVLKSQVEISSVLERKLKFNRLREGAVARINALLNRPAKAPLGVAMDVETARIEIPESLFVQKAIAERQELRVSEAMIRKGEFMKDLARKEYLPNISLGASYITIPRVSSTFSDAGKDAYSIMVGINLPIQFGRRGAAVEEAEATLLASRLSYKNVENNVRAEVSDLHFQLQSTAQTLDLYEEGLLLQAESSLESALSAYRTGKLDFLNLLDSERMLLQTNLTYVKERSNYEKVVAAIERSVGGELPRL